SKKSMTKKTTTRTSATNPHGAVRASGGCPSDSSSNANLSEDCAVVGTSRCNAGPARAVRSRFFLDSPLATGRKTGSRSKNFAERTATVAAQRVAKNTVPTITVGRADPAAARIAIAVAGINCTDLVLIARKVNIAIQATTSSGYNESKMRL